MSRTALVATLATLVLVALAGCGDGETEQASGSAAAREGGAGTPETPTLRFTAIPDKDTVQLEQKFRPVADYLAEALGVPVAYFPTDSYEASVTAFVNEDLHLAWFGGLTGAQARHEVEGARAIAQGKADPTFKSYFIAHPDTGIERSDTFPMALEGKRFTFGSNLSTSGRLMPEYHIREQTGKSPAAFFGMENHYSGAHDATAKLVENGTFQAGALNFKTYDAMVADGRLDPDVARVVWVTPPYADYNFTAHPALEERYGEGFLDRLQRAILDMKDPKLLAAFEREGMIEADNDDFAGIADLAEQLGLLQVDRE